MALIIAAVGLLIAIPLTWRRKLGRGETLDLSPSLHWPAPSIATDRGPVLITATYRVDEADTEAFLDALNAFSQERRRDDAFAWRVFEDTEAPGPGRMLPVAKLARPRAPARTCHRSRPHAPGSGPRLPSQ